MKRSGENQKDLTELVLRAKSGDESALAQLIDETQPQLFRFCYFLSAERQQAEDLCQEAFLKALGSLRSLKEPSRFLPWLMSCAKNLFLDLKRSAHSKKNESLEDRDWADERTSPERTEVILQVRQLLALLSPEEQTVLLLVDMEEYSYQEAADIIGISEPALRSRLHRARKVFAENRKKPERI